MKVLRTPDKYFENIKDYPFDPIYTNIQTKDGTTVRVHHIDEALGMAQFYWQCMDSLFGVIYMPV